MAPDNKSYDDKPFLNRIHNKDGIIKEPDEVKVSRPVRAVRFYETSLYGLGD
jgi:hypothetical protein